jgi:spore photoproduct lyase
MTGPKPRRLWTEGSLLNTSMGKTLAEQLTVAGQPERIPPSDYQNFGKGDVVLTAHHGRFVKSCPGTPEYRCCGLQIIHFGLGCSLDCTYCILQSYLDSPALVLFGNMENGLADLENLLDQADAPKRYCTGEFTDSLLLEQFTGFGQRLVKMFANRPDRILELKTKTDHIDGLLELDHGGRTVISFSVNAPIICETEERRAAPLAKRLAAAERAVKAGYRVGFHFDPLIRHRGWEVGYEHTVEAIYQHVPSERIAWISLGAFRYMPPLKEIVRRRHPNSPIMDQEFIQAADGKMRYLRPVRVEMYTHMLETIRRFDSGAPVYLCMESPRVWNEVFGFDPGPNGLIERLDHRV